MNMISFIIYLAIALSLAITQSVSRNQARLSSNSNLFSNIVDGRFIISFDLDCIAAKEEDGIDIIQDFLGLFQCYTLNENVVDLYPNIVDHWIYIQQLTDCNEDDFALDWDDYCVNSVKEDQQEFRSN